MEDFKRHVAEQQAEQAGAEGAEAAAATSGAYSAQRAAEHEAEQAVELERMVGSLSSRQYKAPQGAVQCTEERDACMQCYRAVQDNGTLPAECAGVVAAFAKCGQAVTDVRGAWRARCERGAGDRQPGLPARACGCRLPCLAVPCRYRSNPLVSRSHLRSHLLALAVVCGAQHQLEAAPTRGALLCVS